MLTKTNKSLTKRWSTILFFVVALIVFCSVLFLAKQGAANNLTGPIAAEVVKVVDGDTIIVKAIIWLNQSVETAVRLRNIDAPELRGKCNEEAMLAQKAKEFVEKRLGKDVFLYDISLDKYGGRVVAKVLFFDKETKENKNIGEELLNAKLAVHYNGGRKKYFWCK